MTVVKEYKNLITTVESYTDNSNARKEIMSKVAEKIDNSSDNEQRMLAIKSYKVALNVLGEQSSSVTFAKIAKEVPEKLNDMIVRQSESPIAEDEFFKSIELVTSLILDQEIFEEQYQKTGLLNNTSTKTAYQIFLDDVDNHFEKNKEQIAIQLTIQPDVNGTELYNAVDEQKTEIIANHIKASLVLQKLDDKAKSITPFTVFSSLYGQEENQEELKEILSSDEAYYTESTIWGAYNIVDNMQASIAKDNMFQIAVLPLTPPNANDEEKQETKVIPLSKAIEHYQEKGDKKGIQAALQSAIVPLIHSSGKKMVFTLKTVFDKIDEEPEYKRHVLEDVETGLPIPFINLLEEMSLVKLLSPGQVVADSNDLNTEGMNDEVLAEVQKALVAKSKIDEAYVVTLRNIQPSEDTVSVAEFLMASALVTLESAMKLQYSLRALDEHDESFATVEGEGYRFGAISTGLVKITSVIEELRISSITLQNLSNIFLDTETENELNPLFSNTDPKLQAKLKSSLGQANGHALSLSPQILSFADKTLNNLMNKEKPEKQKNAVKKKPNNGLGK